MSQAKVFVSWPDYSIDDPETGARLVKGEFEPVLWPRRGARSEDELIAMLKGCIAAIASADPFTDRVMQSNPQLRIISRVGVGVDSVDMEAATRRNIAVSVTSAPTLRRSPIIRSVLSSRCFGSWCPSTFVRATADGSGSAR